MAKPKTKRRRKPTVYLGKKVGKWVVVGGPHPRRLPGGGREYRWDCRCGGCGLVHSVASANLRSSHSSQCRACFNRSRAKADIPFQMWSRAKKGADKRGLPFEVSLDFVRDLLSQQDGRCALTGTPINISETAKGHNSGETTASLDRIDSTLGYTEKNTQWVHKDINKLKTDFPQDRFIELCGLVAKKFLTES